jgi:hypothetical protein
LALAALAAATATGYCGDGVTDYGYKQCDTGMRCVTRANTLAWAGLGPSLGSKTLIVTFRYSVQQYNGSGVGQPVYGLAVTAGASALSPGLHTYALVCTDLGSAGVALELAPAGADPETTASAAWIQWTYGGITCADALDFAVNDGLWTPANLTSFSARYNGVVASDVWLLSGGADSYTFGPPAVCGTECCTNACRRTAPTLNYGACPLGTPSGQAQDFLCQIDGTCTDFQPVEVNIPYGGCGDGIVQPPEVCDAGWMNVATIGSTGCGGISGTFDIAPGSDLSDICGGYTYHAYLPQLKAISSSITATYLTPSPVFIELFANVTYQWTCEDFNTTEMFFRLLPTVPFSATGYPSISVEYAMTKTVPGANCTNWLEYPTYSNTLLLDYAFFLYQDQYGNTTFYSTDPAQRIFRNNPSSSAGDACCPGPSCNSAAPPSTICTDGTPQNVPAYDPWICSGDSVCVQAPSASTTVSTTPSNSVAPSSSVVPTHTPTVTPTNPLTQSITASPTTTASASPTSSIGASPSPTGSVGASTSPTGSPGASTSPTGSPGASTSPTGSIGASGTPTGTSAPSASSSPSLPASASITGSVPLQPAKSNNALIIAGALGGYAGLMAIVVAGGLIVIWRQGSSIMAAWRRMGGSAPPSPPAPSSAAAAQISSPSAHLPTQVRMGRSPPVQVSAITAASTVPAAAPIARSIGSHIRPIANQMLRPYRRAPPLPPSQLQHSHAHTQPLLDPTEANW